MGDGGRDQPDDDTCLLTPDGAEHDAAASTSDEDRRATEWPLPGWERYEPVEFLGAGGMGRVFKAWDRTLQRHVAIKLLTAGDPSTVARFKREARAQARVEHPNVCRVYEVGEVAGYHYIAMQLVDGSPLDLLAPELSLDEIVLLVQGAAEGVHAANRLGLVHRDIKPANIMVSTGEDGGRQAFVVDFGLARDLAGPSQTVTDVVVGTPAYMAPEQARGQTVDRRTDVYGLGATLYALLGGRPPVAGGSAAEMLLNLLHQEPESLRRCDPAIPRDLETIVMSCLSAAAQERYDTTRALADDLGRYLDGEPVAAQPPSLVARWLRVARRNRSVVAVGTVGLVVTLVLLGLWVHASSSANRRAALAQRFGHEVEQIEGFLWRARSLPLHEMTTTRRAARARVAALEVAMEREGPVARDPGHAAVGRALYALYDFEGARTHLEAAWSSGYSTPEVAETLALVYWELYQHAMAQLKQISDDTLRTQRKAEIRTQLRAPAIRLLDTFSIAGSEDSHGMALRASFEGRHEAAIQLAQTAVEAHPWLLEARVLEGLSEKALADRDVDRGEYESAAVALERAAAAVEAATVIGRSDLRAWEALCVVHEGRLHLEVWRAGNADEASHAAAVDACTSAMKIAPDLHRARLTLASVQITWSEHLWSLREDPTLALQQVVELTEAVLAQDPENLQAMVTLGAAHWQRGKLSWLNGTGSPVEAFMAGASACRRASTLYPSDFQAHSNLGLVLMELGNVQMRSGLDPREAVEEATTAFTRAQELMPDSSMPRINGAMVRMVLAGYLIGDGDEVDEGARGPIEKLLDEAEELLDEALTLEPNNSFGRRTFAEVLWYRAFLSSNDDEYCRLTEHAIDHLVAAVEVRPTDASAWQFLLRNRSTQGWCAASRGDWERAREAVATLRREAEQAYAAIPQLDTAPMRAWVEEAARSALEAGTVGDGEDSS